MFRAILAAFYAFVMTALVTSTLCTLSNNRPCRSAGPPKSNLAPKATTAPLRFSPCHTCVPHATCSRTKARHRCVFSSSLFFGPVTRLFAPPGPFDQDLFARRMVFSISCTFRRARSERWRRTRARQSRVTTTNWRVGGHQQDWSSTDEPNGRRGGAYVPVGILCELCGTQGRGGRPKGGEIAIGRFYPKGNDKDGVQRRGEVARGFDRRGKRVGIPYPLQHMLCLPLVLVLVGGHRGVSSIRCRGGTPFDGWGRAMNHRFWARILFHMISMETRWCLESPTKWKEGRKSPIAG